jgi:hypothetical protein
MYAVGSPHCFYSVINQVIGWGFIPSTQLHYRRLILLLILLHVSVVRTSPSKKYITQLATFSVR